MQVRPIRPRAGPLAAVVDAPASKSVTHRALVTAVLADGDSSLVDPLDAEDTRATLRGLESLGARIEVEPGRWSVRGCGGELAGGGNVWLGESGTTMRLLAAVATLGRAPSRLDGRPRLAERPMADLVAALGRLGGAIRFDRPPRSLPLTAGGARPRGGSLTLPGGRSSQYASALMLIGPRLAGGLDLQLASPVVSLPYVRLTQDVLAAFGATIAERSETSWRVATGGLRGREYRIEGDHSSASYFLAAAAIVGGRVRVRGLAPASAQPDARLGALLADLGCRVTTGADWIEVEGSGRLPAFEVDLGEAPDLAPTVAVLGLFSDGPCAIRGVAHLRDKESDRLEVLARNLRALGRHAAALRDRLVIEPPPPCLAGARIATESDHRMAMAFAVAGLRLSGLVVEDPDVVNKSNPRFWEQLEAL